MNICFVANKHLTITYAQVAGHLEREGHRIFWASPSRRWTLWLERAGVPRGSILSLPDFAPQWRDGKADPDAMAGFESASLPTCQNVLLMCRGLRELDQEVAQAYLLVVMQRFGEFAAEHRLDVVFSEATWGFEFGIALSAARHGVLWLAPNSVRIPDNRFGFFRPYPHQLVTLRAVTAEDHAWATGFYARWRERPRPPAYSRKITSPVQWRRHWLDELKVGILSSHLDRDDQTLWPLHKRIVRRAGRGVAAAAIRLRPPFQKQSDRPFVLMCLHQQPEASVDVVGAFHSDQAQAVARIARLLPASHQLWVKEHPDALGSRPPAWHRQLSSIANVVLIEPHADTFDLCRRASFVVTISGTVAYESALLGTPSATFAPIYFGPLLSVDANRLPDPLCWDLRSRLDCREGPAQVAAKAIAFLAWIKAQSFPGVPFDPVQRQLVGRDPANVDEEAAGFAEALRLIALQKAAGQLSLLPH